jgi:hypothetical protein
VCFSPPDRLNANSKPLCPHAFPSPMPLIALSRFRIAVAAVSPVLYHAVFISSRSRALVVPFVRPSTRCRQCCVPAAIASFTHRHTHTLSLSRSSSLSFSRISPRPPCPRLVATSSSSPPHRHETPHAFARPPSLSLPLPPREKGSHVFYAGPSDNNLKPKYVWQSDGIVEMIECTM